MSRVLDVVEAVSPEKLRREREPSPERFFSGSMAPMSQRGSMPSRETRTLPFSSKMLVERTTRFRRSLFDLLCFRAKATEASRPRHARMAREVTAGTMTARCEMFLAEAGRSMPSATAYDVAEPREEHESEGSAN